MCVCLHTFDMLDKLSHRLFSSFTFSIALYLSPLSISLSLSLFFGQFVIGMNGWVACAQAQMEKLEGVNKQLRDQLRSLQRGGPGALRIFRVVESEFHDPEALNTFFYVSFRLK